MISSNHGDQNLAEFNSGGTRPINAGGRIQFMNTQPLELETHVDETVTEIDELTLCGFNQEEIVSLLWLRQWYQTGGSDRMEVVRNLEFLKHLVESGRITA
jgi:hypothetical protein